MNALVFSLILILAGILYLFLTRKKAPKSFSIASIAWINVLLIGLIPMVGQMDGKSLTGNLMFISMAVATLAFLLGWIILKKDLQWLSWIALLLPFAFFLVQIPEGEEKSKAFTYVQIGGMGAVFPLMVHFLNIFISNMAQPMDTPIKIHKQLISLMLGIAILGFMIIVSNFILGKDAIYLLAIGIFSTSVLFTGYNLNGQKSFPTLVFLLLGIVIFSQFMETYKGELNLGMYQFFSGFLFGISALFLSAFASSWASESHGFFARIIFAKSIFGPLIFVFLSGFFFFVYEAFGGRLSLSATLLGAVFALPILNQIFENRTYGGMSIIFGASLMIMPMLQHDKVEIEKVVQTDTLETELQKLTYTGDNGQKVETKLNDITLAKGDWVVDEENSIIEFKVLGEESVTDGFFKAFTGKLSVGDDFTKTALNIDIPVAKISTYNKTRDNSIREEEIFFEEAKFPNIQYKIESIGVENDQYTANGEFIMKGISAPLKTNFIFAAKGTEKGKEIIILEGNGSLDRTKFGQESDASIGDEVTFTFKVIYRKA